MPSQSAWPASGLFLISSILSNAPLLRASRVHPLTGAAISYDRAKDNFIPQNPPGNKFAPIGVLEVVGLYQRSPLASLKGVLGK